MWRNGKGDRPRCKRRGTYDGADGAQPAKGDGGGAVAVLNGVGGPHHVSDEIVDDGRPDDGEDDPGRKLHALGDRAAVARCPNRKTLIRRVGGLFRARRTSSLPYLMIAGVMAANMSWYMAKRRNGIVAA